MVLLSTMVPFFPSVFCNAFGPLRYPKPCGLGRVKPQALPFHPSFVQERSERLLVMNHFVKRLGIPTLVIFRFLVRRRS